MPTRFWPVTAGRGFVGRLETGSDLVEEIERHCAEHGVTAAQVTVIGAVRRARFAYYEQEDRRYRELESDTHHEITGFVANVSMREGKPFLHAHATLLRRRWPDGRWPPATGHRGLRRGGHDSGVRRRRARPPARRGDGARAVVMTGIRMEG